MSSTRYPDLRNELWLADRLGPRSEFYPFAGATTGPQRRARMRARILELGWQNKRAGYAGNDPETFAEVFERMYGVPLTTRDDEE